MRRLLETWGHFISIVLNPLTTLLTLLGVFLGIVLVSLEDPKNAPVAAALALMIAVVSCVVGAISYNKWTQASSQKAASARGEATVRSLNLVLRNINALHGRTQQYLDRHNDEGYRKSISEEVIKTYLEEISRTLVVLQEETISSIENWADVVPEADIRSQLGMITSLTREVSLEAEELEQMKRTFREEKTPSEEEKKELAERIRQKEANLAELRKELAHTHVKYPQIGGALSANTIYAARLTAGTSTLSAPAHPAEPVKGKQTFPDDGGSLHPAVPEPEGISEI